MWDMTTGKTIVWLDGPLLAKCLCFLICCLGLLQLFFQGASVLILWLRSPFAVIFQPKRIKAVTVSIVSTSICHEMMGLDAMILLFWMLSFRPTFSLSFCTFHQEALQFLFAFCHKGDVICISEVIDISPGNLDSSLWFTKPGISHDVLCIMLMMHNSDNAVKVLYSICQQIWKTQQWPQDWKRSAFVPVPKKDNAKEGSNHCTIALIWHASKVMLKILQARL